jgi:hypothetical protein
MFIQKKETQIKTKTNQEIAHYHEFLICHICDDILSEMRYVQPKTPKQVWDEVIIPMEVEGTYCMSLLEEAFVRVMEVDWNIDPKEVFQLVEDDCGYEYPLPNCRTW